MKKYLSSLLVVLMISGSVLAVEASDKSAEKSKKTMAIAFNPLGLLFLTLSGSYGIAVSDKIALMVPLNLTYLSASVTYGSGKKSSDYLFGIGSGFGARFYLAGQTFDGLYLQPMGEIYWYSFGGSASALGLVGYGMLGYSWLWDSGFNLNLAGGAGYHYMSTKAEAKGDLFSLTGILPALEFSIGYAW